MQTWQRNLYVIWIAEFTAIIGFSVIQPFIPYFIQDLGVTDLAQVELYSGLSLSVNALTMAVSAPIWGALADRYGRKIMVERAMFSAAVLFAVMGMVQDVQSLLFLRALQGCFTGTITAATTLVATSTPRERAGYALGLLQVAIYVGALVGPMLGGVISDQWGYRAAFDVTSVSLALSGIMVHVLVVENFQPAAQKAQRESFWQSFRQVLLSPMLVSIFALRLLLRLGERTLQPVLPLFVQTLAPAETKIATVTGLIVGVSAAASAVGAGALGRASDRLGPRPILLFCAFGAALFYLPQFLAADTTQLLIFYSLTGFMIGGTLTSLTTLLAKVAPEGRQGAVYGVDSSVLSLANAMGPMMGAGISVVFGLRPTFLFAAALFVVAGLAVARLLPATPRSGPAGEA
jgi:MFS transporter, DHA1 family, multidrug resistance protein